MTIFMKNTSYGKYPKYHLTSNYHKQIKKLLAQNYNFQFKYSIYNMHNDATDAILFSSTKQHIKQHNSTRALAIDQNSH